jgi:hypothetical protein
LFTELTGNTWYDDASIDVDEEHKVTEFDYENYFHPKLLTPEITESKEFKKFVKMLNFFSTTQYERLQE